MKVRIRANLCLEFLGVPCSHRSPLFGYCERWLFTTKLPIGNKRRRQFSNYRPQPDVGALWALPSSKGLSLLGAETMIIMLARAGFGYLEVHPMTIVAWCGVVHTIDAAAVYLCLLLRYAWHAHSECHDG